MQAQSVAFSLPLLQSVAYMKILTQVEMGHYQQSLKIQNLNLIKLEK
jgi:hypothetical protein